MQRPRVGLRVVLLSLSLLSACAGSGSSRSSSADGDTMQGDVLGNYLAGRFALSEGDAATASRDLLKAAAERPNDPELTEQALIATLLAGRPEAVKLASRVPDNQFSRLVLANVDVKAGRWSVSRAAFPQAAAQEHDAPAPAAVGGLGAARWRTAEFRPVDAAPLCRGSKLPLHLSRQRRTHSGSGQPT